jgi:hypothetical protein
VRKRKLRWVAVVLLIAAGAFVAWPPPPRVTRENFDRLQEGMTPAEAKAILGPPGDYTTGPCFEHPFGPGGHSGDLTLPYHLLWTTDTLYVHVCYGDAGKVAGLAWGIPHRQEQSPLENLVWRAKRQWRKWFPR